MSEFKVGDRVRCIDNDGVTLTVGREYEVTEVSSSQSGWIEIRNDSGAAWSYIPGRFELVEPRKDSPKVGDLVRVVLEAGVTRVSGATVWLSPCDGDSYSHDVDTTCAHVKSVEILKPAKPSVSELPPKALVRDTETGEVWRRLDANWWESLHYISQIKGSQIDQLKWEHLGLTSNG